MYAACALLNCDGDSASFDVTRLQSVQIDARNSDDPAASGFEEATTSYTAFTSESFDNFLSNVPTGVCPFFFAIATTKQSVKPTPLLAL